MAEVKVYSTPTCPYCKLVKQFLEENQVAFSEVDVSTSQMAAEEMIAKSGQLGVPVIEIDGQVIVGFDKARIRQILNI
jgi:glutaredoxin-like YruB-family protein